MGKLSGFKDRAVGYKAYCYFWYEKIVDIIGGIKSDSNKQWQSLRKI